MAADPETLRRISVQVRSMRKERFVTSAPGKCRAGPNLKFAMDAVWAVHDNPTGMSTANVINPSARLPAFIWAWPCPLIHGQWHDTVLEATRLCDGLGVDTIVMQSLIEWMVACHQENFSATVCGDLFQSNVGGPEFIRKLVRALLRGRDLVILWPMAHCSR